MFPNRSLIAAIAAAALFCPVAFADEIAVPGADRRVHEVVRGDTLWDIANAYLEDPFMWPKIWWQNEQVTNPDLIYPGGRIRIPVALLKPDIRQEIEAKVAMPVEMIEVQVESGVINPLVVEAAGYLARDVPAAGKVIGMHEEHFLLGQDDDIFVKLAHADEVMPGARYQVVRPVVNVYHPVSHKRMGKMVRVLGVVTVTGDEGRLKLAHVERSFDVINSGDLLVPYVTPDVTVSREHPALQGVIVATRDGRTIVGTDDVVYLDRGSADGLEPGVELRVVRKGNRIDPEGVWGSYRLPDRGVATLQVLSVQEGTAAARIQGALEHIEVGDRFEGLPEGKGAA